MHVAIALALCYALDFLARLVEIAANEPDFGPEGAHGLDFGGVAVVFGAVDDHWYAKKLTGVRQRLAVIAGARADDSPLPLGRG